ncbi:MULTISPECIES: DUF1840 domain-containing protein [Legionella]|uniref:DUF1840 domain-containing protein n=1 Tax=Legionella septentrionalis TaxID=2498109 RepID=A0A3S0WSA4_9GAMM|nr:MULTISPECIES: DUF1840 domain-containing protein [Legionella]MCP0914174.1 DUF1840 domain-containing protein [Legionella sp. 27cVA30]RUQ89247.1 DUF1840 domain-containing protein [Legionella septentrionalis]RUQ94613.1 DUF1840 domain-containing protein [Legionella septentrionalis]RUR11719.1 DUF1840 domain-containing protein [Legionella septentrionalis]RUR17407.1 DUF1840 domain-containing protein [Legionella septentrionalis]
MLVTFSCPAHENITMFGDVAIHLLKIMGHSGTVPSAMLADEVPEALSRLQQAVDKEKKKSQPGARLRQDEEEDEPAIGLVQRALPLLDLLKDAAAAKCNVMWK